MSPPLEEHQLLEGLSVVHLKLIGLWHAINTYLTTGRRSRGLNLLAAYSVLAPIPYEAFQVLSLFFVHLDIKTLISICLNCVPGVQATLKVMVFWTRIDEECDIFTLLRQDFLTCIPKHKMPQVREIYRRNAKLCNVYCVMAFVGMVMCISSWVAVPGIKGEDSSGTETVKVMGGWYPFPFSQSPWYEIVYVEEAVLITTHGLLISFFECVMIQPLVCLCAHFQVLGYHISTLKVADAVHSEAKDGSEYLNKELKAVLSDYDKLLRYAAVLQDILNVLVTVVLGTGMVVLITGILQFMLEVHDAMFVFHFLTYLSYPATEVFLICVSSAALETASGDLRFALYSSDWYLADKKYCTTAQMMMIRAQKPLTLIALKMYRINKEIIVGLFQFSYTVAMVLSQSKE